MQENLIKSEFTFLFECSSSQKIRSLIAQAVLHNFRILPLGKKDLRVLDHYGQKMAQGKLIPVGSREFVLSAIKAADLKAPISLDYVSRLQWAYNRNVILNDMGNLADCFALQNAPVWRYYVLNDEVVGCVRVDEKSSQNALNLFSKKPSDSFVLSCIDCFNDSHIAPYAYALDVALVADTFGLINSAQKEVLVQIHDAWALDIHPKMQDKSAFMDMLIFRWLEITRDSRLGPSADSQVISANHQVNHA